MDYTKEQIENAVKSKGHVWFDADADYDVNIIGIRNANTGDAVTNAFDDQITLSYKENGNWMFHQWPCTTDPGRKSVMEFDKKLPGVAILVEGQYLGSHGIGLHHGKYEALTQQKPVKVYRDPNRDMVYNEDKIQEGTFGINIHHAGPDSTIIEDWSAGCQVFKRIADFDEFMNVCRKARDIHGNSFTYTLIDSKDVI